MKQPSINQKDIHQLFDDFNQLNVLIIGDVMIDAYYFGKVDRISPEAPVPIVAVEKRENRLGGAANVALNVQALGGNPILCSAIGNDEDGAAFEHLLTSSQLTAKGLLKLDNRVTTVKTRVIGNNHQLLRVDSETETPLNNQESNALFDVIKNIITTEKVDVVIFEDYDKGVITPTLIEKVVELCNDKNIPTTVDPKKKNFLAYKNVTLFKPNLKELREGLNLDIKTSDINSIINALKLLHEELHPAATLITLSEHGMLIFNTSSHQHIPAHIRNIADVSGAGDTVISVASLCLALKQPNDVIAQISNLAGGLVCEKVGVVPINKNILLKETLNHLAE
jgi:D-glycero-beta-D-manno-heptose-7-phosphate kinase